MVVSDLGTYGGSKELMEVLSSTGLKEFYPPQAMAIKAGLLQGWDSFVISAPTAAGKTLIAEMAALKLHLEKGGKIIYTVPLRALAREKFEDLTKKYSRIGMKMVQSTGDYDRADPWLREADLIISTNEKMDSLIRHHAPWLKDVNLVVADEIHLMGDAHRGPTLEVVLSRLKWMNPKLRFIALSATIPNALQIARWLGAKLIASAWRPVPLREGVYFDDAVIFNDGEVKWIERESRVDAVDLALATIREGGQALIFVNTRKATETTALRAAVHTARLLSSQEQDALKRLSHDTNSASSEPTRLDKKLAELVAGGAAFHHAGIISSQRKLIEDAFRANKLKLVVATTTLAMGLNLPSRRVVIRDWRRYESGAGMLPIPVMEIKQMSGRAGRPGFDEYGEAVLIARHKKDEQYLFENYIKGEPEEIRSRLGSESALRTHVLASIAGGFTMSREELKYFLAHTFFAQQSDPVYLLSITDDIVDFLRSEDMVEADKGLTATRFGHRVSELYIDPLAGVVLRDALQMKKDKEAFSLLHMVVRTPDMMKLQLKKNDIDEMLSLYHANIEKLLIPRKEKQPTEEMLAQVKTAWVLMQWIQETPEDGIVGRFDIGPGDLHALVELADWLLYAASEIARVFGLREEVKTIFLLRTRVLYGVKEELLPLVSLRNIGRIRARNLFNTGYKSPKEIRKATAEELSKVSAIGKAIAEDIKRQVEMPEKGIDAAATDS
jgi:helicase